MRRIYKFVLSFCVFLSPFNIVLADPIPDWKPIKPNSKKTPPPAPIQKPKEEKIITPQYPIIDESQELLSFDNNFALSIKDKGPLQAYSDVLSEFGILYDAAGGSPTGKDAAIARFEKFPANIVLIRKPDSALSNGGAGASWGKYEVISNNIVLAKGQYSSVWRKEEGVWKLITELAAGVDKAPPPLPIKPVPPKAGNKKEISNNLLRPNDPLKDVLGREIKGN